MRTIFGLLAITMAFETFCEVPAKADACNCSVTGRCVCRPGTCQCPNCPGNINARPIIVQYAAPVVQPYQPQQQFATVYPVAPVFAVPAYQAAAPVYYQPAQPSSGCYFNGREWICPNNNTLTGGQRRAIRRANRRGFFSGLFGE